jgi:alpha-beta hydrolase superfamily lysophospholipase
MHGRYFLVLILPLLAACGESGLEPWHTVELDAEYGARTAAGIETFADYLDLETRLFNQVDDEIYALTPSGPGYTLNRYSQGSAADPGQYRPNWNRSFELVPDSPRGGVLLLHGMSDSPYSLRALGEMLYREGYRVLGLRLPGHGTIPAGLLAVHWEDMAGTVRIAMSHLHKHLDGGPIHIVGYSTGAALALDFSLDAEAGEVVPMPTSLVLISPAIGVSPAAALATWKRRLSLLPGLQSLAWLGIDPEFDPYKYNSFTTNAGEQVHRLTRRVASRLAARTRSTSLPPMLVLKSTVDATVSTNAVVDRLLLQLAPGRHELVLFDINRSAVVSPLLITDPGPLTRRLLDDPDLTFTLTLVSNESVDSNKVVATRQPPHGATPVDIQSLDTAWPRGVVSLSHVALPFPPDDPLYGSEPPAQEGRLYLGQIPLSGERGLLRISTDWLLRLRHNPFYEYLEERTLDWLALHDSAE